MITYVTVRFKNGPDQKDIERLCAAVKASGMTDYCFVRDVEAYKNIFSSPKELWDRTNTELKKCDALLIDVSDQPSGGRVVEAGMAFALGMPIFVIVKPGVKYKNVFDGIATKVIEYQDYNDITAPLAEYLGQQQLVTAKTL